MPCCKCANNPYDPGTSEPVAAFDALNYDPVTYELLGVKTGVGGLTVASTTTHFADDHEGIYREYAANTPVWSGARFAENKLRHNLDLENAVWNGVDLTVTPSVEINPYGGGDVFAVSGTASTLWSLRQLVTTNTPDLWVSIWVKRNAGVDQSFRIYTGGAFSPELIATDTWQRFTFQYVGTQANNQYNVLTRNVAKAGAELFVYAPTLEGKTVVPQPIINTTTAAISKSYANANGNTVSGNIVTETVGTLLPDQPWLKYEPAASNVLFPSTTIGTETVNLPVGTWSINCIVNGSDNASSIVTAGTATATGYGTATPSNLIELDVTVEGTVSIENTGAILCCNVISGATAISRELGPIFTTTAAVSTTETLYSHDIANHADLGCYYMEVNGIDGAENIWATMLSIVGTDFQLTDGTLTATQPYTNGVHKIGFAFAESLMSINVDGTWSADVAYDGTLLTGALDYFRAGGFAGKIRNNQRYDTTTLAEGKAIIDGLMFDEGVDTWPAKTLGNGWSQVRSRSYTWDKTNWTTGLYPALEFTGFVVGSYYRVSGNITTFTGTENMRVRWGTSSNNLTITTAGTFDHTEVMGSDPSGILQFICNSSNGNTLIEITDLVIEKLPDPDITLDASTLGLANLDPVTSMGFLTTSNAPTYNTSVQNGLGVIKFDGVANEMNGVLAVSMVQFSYYMVVKYGTHKDNAGIMSVGPTGGADWDNDNGVNFGGHGGASNVNQVAIRRGSADDILSQWGIPPVIGDFFLLEGHIDTVAGTFSGRVNGGTEFTDIFDHLTPINPDIFVLGCRVAGGVPAASYSDMTFGEARLYNKLISLDEQKNVRNYLMSKWGL